MAPTYQGEHFQLSCDDCQCPFSIDANNVPKSGLAVCPNCGTPKNRFSEQAIQSATRMTVHQPVDSISRWDVIAFNEPGIDNRDKKRLLTKRVVGLPGETIQFRGGNLLIDGKLLRKPSELNQQIRIPIFDSQFNDKSKTKRLVAPSGDSSWHADSDGWSFDYQAARDDVQSASGSFDWLDYRHIRGYRHSGGRYDLFPIEDDYGYNQNVARQLHRVNEVMLQLQIENAATAQFAVSLFPDQEQSCKVVFQFDRRKLLVTFNNENPLTFDASWLNSPKSVIEVSNFDRQLQISHNHETRYQQTFPAGNTPNPKPIDAAPSVQIRLGASKGNVQLSHLRIFRDLFYYCETTDEADDAFKFELATDQYFVLGDNVPISVDSRIFGPISRSSIVGLVQPATSDD